jgi:general secretion pathway protein L
MVWSKGQKEVIASGSLSDLSQLGEIQDYARQRITIVMLSAQDVVLSEVDVPAGATRQFDAMLPYLVEEYIAQDVDDLHFTVLGKRAGRAHICAVDRSYLTQVLSQFSDCQIEVKKVLPDVLCLPDNGVVSAVTLGKQCLIRKDAYNGISIDQQWLAHLVASGWLESPPESVESDSEGKHDAEITYYSAQSDTEHLPQGRVRWKTSPIELPMALLSQGAIEGSANLLTGPFKSKTSFLKYWNVWQKAVVAGFVFLVVLLVQQVVLVNQYENQASAYREESERIFRAVFPDKQRIPTTSYLKRQMESELFRLGGGAQSTETLLAWLAKLPDTLGQVSGMDVQNLKYDGKRKEVRVSVTSRDFQSFEAARVKLETQFVVEQGPLNRNGELVMGNFLLKLK